MKKDNVTFKTIVNDDHAATITERMIECNQTHFDRWAENHDDRYQAQPLHIYAFDPSRQLIGGLTARTHSIRAWLEISVIFVDAAWRGQGIGRDLMTRAETEGRRRGCLYSRLSTSDFQAPGFYEKPQFGASHVTNVTYKAIYKGGFERNVNSRTASTI